MTENEAIDKLNNLHYKILHSSFSSMVYVSEIEALCMAKDVLQEIQQYRAIGTIEEFKALKEDKNFLEFLYNQILPNEMEQYLSMYHAKDKAAVNGYADQCGLMSAT